MNKKIGFTGFVMALALITGSGMLVAQQSDSNSNTAGQMENSTKHTWNKAKNKTSRMMANLNDTTFAKMADEGNLAEVKLAKLAKDKSNSEAVKNFADRIIQDHTQANQKLQDAAQQENVSLPDSPNQHQQDAYARLSKLSGEQFNRAYARSQVRDHEQDIRMYEHEANNGQKEHIKSYAQNTLPTLKSHLQQAKQMEQQVMQSSNMKNGSSNSTY